MWSRANMAAVTLLLLLGWISAFADAEGGRGGGSKQQQTRAAGREAPARQPDAAAMLERASAWLWSQRDKDAGWGNDTQQVLLALRLANLSREDNVPPPASLEMQLSTKQMELEIVLMLWRHREMSSSPVRLARYTLALNAMCMDPRQFHGHDLIGTLQHHEPPTDYEFALTALAACNAQAHVRKRQMRRLLDIAHTAQDHSIDTVSMGIMTLRCIVQDHRHRNLQHFVRKPSASLAQRQRRDGGFGDLRSTALALQALEELENESLDNWNRSGALAWLAGRQRPDGSFDGSVSATAEVVLGLAPRGMASIRTLDCGQGLTDSPPPRIAGATGESLVPLNRNGPSTSGVLPTVSSSQPSSTLSSNNNSNNKNNNNNNNNNNYESSSNSSSSSQATTIENESTLSSSSVVGQQQPPLVNVTYTLWVGSDVSEIRNLTITAPKNETFYEVMVLAAQRSTDFQFSAYEWPNGHYVHTLAGYKEEPMSYHYWLLYRLPAPPEPKSPPGNQFVAPGGVDDLQISDGEHYLFWYKKL